MILYIKKGSRYQEAQAGERLAAAVETLKEIGLSDLAFELNAMMLDKIGYYIPQEVRVEAELFKPGELEEAVRGSRILEQVEESVGQGRRQADVLGAHPAAGSAVWTGRGNEQRAVNSESLERVDPEGFGGSDYDQPAGTGVPD